MPKTSATSQNPTRHHFVFSAVLASVLVAGGCAGSGTGDRAGSSATSTSQPPLTRLDRLTTAYPNERVDPSAAAWEALLADEQSDTAPLVVVEFVQLDAASDARANYNAYLDELAQAIVGVEGEMLSVNDTLMPGLEGLEGYAGGVSWVASFPTIAAYINAMLDDRVVAVADKRRDAVTEAQVLAGPNLLPDVIKQLPPNEPASDFPSDRVAGKHPDQIVGELLAVYPSGGADPTRSTLEAMVAFDGFVDRRVHFINLYRFNDDVGGGAAALGEYNAAALPAVLAHGGRPKALVNVTHHLVGPVAWDRFIFVSWPSLAVFTDLRLDPTYIEAQTSRVLSGDQYGNLITLARADGSR